MDLHIHTCLSPCGASKSVPTTIVAAALKAGLQAIAICDHNASENWPAVRRAAEGTSLTVLGGMEITTQSEIHLLGIFDFDHAEGLEEMQRIIYSHLPGDNNPDIFGPQYIVDHEDYITGLNEHLLIGATDLELETIVTKIHEFGGIAIASHIDREAYGIISQLGIIPEDTALDALELSRNYNHSPFQFKGLGFPFVTFSDAHEPRDIGTTKTEFLLKTPTVRELQLAVKEQEGRRILSSIQF